MIEPRARKKYPSNAQNKRKSQHRSKKLSGHKSRQDRVTGEVRSNAKKTFEEEKSTKGKKEKTQQLDENALALGMYF